MRGLRARCTAGRLAGNPAGRLARLWIVRRRRADRAAGGGLV